MKQSHRLEKKMAETAVGVIMPTVVGFEVEQVVSMMLREQCPVGSQNPTQPDGANDWMSSHVAAQMQYENC